MTDVIVFSRFCQVALFKRKENHHVTDPGDRRSRRRKQCLVEPEAQLAYLVDWTNRFHGKTQAVVRPANTDEVSRVMAIAYAHGVPVVPQSGNTSLVGGSTPDSPAKLS